MVPGGWAKARRFKDRFTATFCEAISSCYANCHHWYIICMRGTFWHHLTSQRKYRMQKLRIFSFFFNKTYVPLFAFKLHCGFTLKALNITIWFWLLRLRARLQSQLRKSKVTKWPLNIFHLSEPCLALVWNKWQVIDSKQERRDQCSSYRQRTDKYFQGSTDWMTV